MFIVAALYKFVKLDTPKMFKEQLQELAIANKITGTLILAEEGINGTVAGTRKAINNLQKFFSDNECFDNLEYKESQSKKNPFMRLKVKLKKEIVTLGKNGVDTINNTGTHVTSSEWDKLLEDPEVTVLDVRNNYETAIGMFENALDPDTENFRQFPDFVKSKLDPKVHKKIAMSCTGGIRCEKASAYMKQVGFEEVYQLKGGVLRYLEVTDKKVSKWDGECFVFDQRVAVDHDLAKGKFDCCFGCRLPISKEDKKSKDYLEGVYCPKCKHVRSDEQKSSALERQRQIALAKTRGESHLSKR